ncbi:MAG: hypothetical protein K1X88_27755, partial [Nannocystaceae bacterium]|nr:hypothetical protein [Nannocystaceae bacterium]
MLRAARLSGLALAALLAWLAPPDVRACQCAQARPELAPSLAGAAAVVRARVRSHAFVTGEGFHTELVVEEVFKGTPGRVLALDAAKTCAFGFEPGGRYLVFAYADGDAGFTTTYCTRTAPLGDATADVAWLRKHASARVVPRP